MLLVRCLGVIHSDNLWMKFSSLIFFLMIIKYRSYQFESAYDSYALYRFAVTSFQSILKFSNSLLNLNPLII